MRDEHMTESNSKSEITFEYISLRRAFIALLLVGGLILATVKWDTIINTHINSELLIEYINALKYPLIILFFGLFYHKQIKEFIRDTEKVDTKYGTLTRKKQQTGDTDAIKEILFDSNQDNEQSDIHSTDDHSQMHELLISPQVVAEFNRIFSTIWGSQYEALKLLEKYGVDGLAPEDLHECLELHKKRVPEGTGFNTVTELMAYPVAEILVKYDASSRTYYLTNAGQYFLNYLREKGIFESEMIY